MKKNLILITLLITIFTTSVFAQSNYDLIINDDGNVTDFLITINDDNYKTNLICFTCNNTAGTKTIIFSYNDYTNSTLYHFLIPDIMLDLLVPNIMLQTFENFPQNIWIILMQLMIIRGIFFEVETSNNINDFLTDSSDKIEPVFEDYENIYIKLNFDKELLKEYKTKRTQFEELEIPDSDSVAIKTVVNNHIEEIKEMFNKITNLIIYNNKSDISSIDIVDYLFAVDGY